MTTTTIPFTLPRAVVLTLNQRPHWAEKARRTAHLRTLAKHHARQYGGRHQRANCTAWLTFPDGRRRDAHNWTPTAKALIDGAVDAGLIPDDSTEYLTGPDMRITDRRCPVGQVWIDLTFTERETP